MACFNKWDVGGCGCAATTICITTCSGAIPLDGGTITVTGLGSCTTDATGCCTAPWLTSGSHGYTVVDSAGNTLATASKTWTAGAANTVSIIAPTSGKCCGVNYVPATLTATDAIGTFTMKFAGTDGSGNPYWTGGRYAPGTVWDCAAGTTYAGSTRSCYTLTCISGGTPAYTLTRDWAWACFPLSCAPGTKVYFDNSGVANVPGNPCSVAGGGLACTNGVDTSSGTITSAATNDPFTIAFSMTPAGGNQTTDPVGGGVSISQ
jgi:hypothetical protein